MRPPSASAAPRGGLFWRDELARAARSTSGLPPPRSRQDAGEFAPPAWRNRLWIGKTAGGAVFPRVGRIDSQCRPDGAEAGLRNCESVRMVQQACLITRRPRWPLGLQVPLQLPRVLHVLRTVGDRGLAQKVGPQSVRNPNLAHCDFSSARILRGSDAPLFRTAVLKRPQGSPAWPELRGGGQQIFAPPPVSRMRQAFAGGGIQKRRRSDETSNAVRTTDERSRPRGEPVAPIGPETRWAA